MSLAPSATPLAPSPAPPVQGKVLQAVSTTTVFSGPSIIVLPASSSKQSVPVGSIVGGVLGGVCLAVAAVLAWHWWGKSIKRKEDKEKQEQLAFLKLRENTRRNASASMEKTYDGYKSPSILRTSGDRVIKFSSSSSEAPTLQSVMKSDNGEKERDSEKEDVVGDIPVVKPLALRGHTHAPVKSSPLAQTSAALEPDEASGSDESRPALPRTLSSRSDNNTMPKRNALEVPAPNLAHKPSLASSISVYSTQSGEERQQLVPPSLIMAALTRPDPRKPIVDRLSLVPGTLDGLPEEQNRLSHISAGSVYLQHPDDPADPSSEPDGYAK